MVEHKELPAQRFTPTLPKWCIVGYAEISTSGKSIRIRIMPNYNLQRIYLGIEDLKGLLSGRKKIIQIYIPKENLGR